MSDTIEKDWQKALKKNTLSSYRKFLRKHPETEYVDKALSSIDKILDEIIWRNVKDENTTWAYEYYLHNYPKGKYVTLALNTIKELHENNVWEHVKNTKEIKPLIAFIEQFPESKYKQKALKRIKMLEKHDGERRLYLRAVSAKSYDLYKKYIRKYPDGLFIDEIEREFAFIRQLQNRIKSQKSINYTITENNEELDWQLAKARNDLSAYGEFYKKYPQSKYAAEAKQKIDDFEDLELQKMLKSLEERLWNQLLQNESLSNCNEYLMKFPKGYRSSEVKEILTGLQPDKPIGTNTTIEMNEKDVNIIQRKINFVRKLISKLLKP